MADLTPSSTSTSRYKCGSYAPGHDLHWIHWKRLQDAPGLPVHAIAVGVHGLWVRLDTPGGSQVWWNHDLARVRDLGPVRGRVLLWPRLHAMRVDGYLFNLARFPTACGAVRRN